MKSRALCACFLACALLSCGSGKIGGVEARPDVQGAVPGTSLFSVQQSSLSLREIDWNPKHSDVGVIATLAEVDDMVVVFGSKGATVLSGDTVQATDASVTAWAAAATIPAADGAGLWAAAVSNDGHLYRIHDGQSLDDITDRYGLSGIKVQSVAGMGTTYVGFGFDTGLAVADGTTVTQYATALSSVSGANGRLAGVALNGSAQVFDGASKRLTQLDVVGARGAAVDASGRVFIASDHALYLADDSGSAKVVFPGGSQLVHSVVAAGNRVWFGLGSELCAVNAAIVSCTTGQSLRVDATLHGSTTGDVWVLSQGVPRRFAPAASGDEAQWRVNVLPIYAASCSSCHDQGAPSGIDLSSYTAWTAHRQLIDQRVAVKRDMPPGGALSNADRATISTWALSQAP